MKILHRTALFWALLQLGAGSSPAEPVPYILDTDIASDCDDAGAAAMANALADNGEAEILAMMVSTGGPWGAPALCAINTWYGRGDVPIGTLKDSTFWVGGGRDKPSGAYNYESYNHALALDFPTRLKSGTEAPDARLLYRKILASRPDQSVVINSIGPLINLAGLLQTAADESSPLKGADLVKAKVKLLVVAGGKNPTGTSSNFSKEKAKAYTKPVIEQWPGPVVFVGNEVGGTIDTGWSLNREATAAHPARAAYRLFHAGDDAKKRPSWDQAAVLFAIRGTGSVYELVANGHMACDGEGTNRWIEGAPEGKQHAYVRKKENADGLIQAEIEALMTQAPKKAGNVGFLNRPPPAQPCAHCLEGSAALFQTASRRPAFPGMRIAPGPPCS